ncbi:MULTISPECIES: putative nucleotidyltransferase substrate binding domain-containing protein [unclassified Ruegeria]|uniref:putative nucleotidyltransferase substrate binding domain-containing protein n=1 Tax=unclassified Ruegeria TaxID=2625375 RepID=UPI0014881FB2|nr:MULTISPECIES: putative nucleotidyltransferase substrate binding domain-containing protein [unclassified Ruegeria]NOD33720.1 CBS domain-containing protein [Ruegeria sp. HKCCD7296]NOE40605.1 CBS domain-containing protein [Ruegeria sp. HKCCD7319]
MPLSHDEIARFLKSVHPYDALPSDALDQIVKQIEVWEVEEDASVYELGHKLPGVFVIYEGQVEITDENGAIVSHLGLRNSFGERGLLKDGKAATKARTHTPSVLMVLPPDLVRSLIDNHDVVAKFFDRTRGDRSGPQSLATSSIDVLMAHNPATCPADTSVQDAARIMRDKHISSLCITDAESLQGIATLRDISGKYVADGLPASTHISEIMTPNPVTLSPSDIGSDVLHIMMERGIGHIPISEGGRLVGIVTQTDLTHYQAVNSAELVRRIAQADTAEEMARVTEEIPQLLVQLVAGGNRHEIVTRLITDIADTATRRLLALAEIELGPPPVPYLWLACGSQGRQEQTGVSDQDNCLMLDDNVTDADMAYFTKLAKFVSDGLDICGYFYCPGDMMATNPRWCQPVRVWRDYFKGWIAKPNPEAQMLASVMFDLRPIGGAFELFADLQADTLAAARANSIFVAHMISNSLKHTPPLGLLRGFATIRSGEHRNTLDLKHNGVVPVVDLARIYTLQGELTEANTRARLKAAEASGVLSPSGARDLLDAYDLIAETRLEHQVRLVKSGEKPDNYLPPSDLSDFERSHLRDAFVVVKTMQSAVGHGKGMLG